jgi:hypothetical protein
LEAKQKNRFDFDGDYFHSARAAYNSGRVLEEASGRSFDYTAFCGMPGWTIRFASVTAIRLGPVRANRIGRAAKASARRCAAFRQKAARAKLLRGMRGRHVSVLAIL